VLSQKESWANRPYAILISLLVTEFAFEKNVSDPINPLKLSVLGVLAAWSIANLTSGRQFFNLLRRDKQITIYFMLLTGLMCAMLINFLVMPVKSIGLFGDSGRNLGLLYYFFLALIALYVLSKVNLQHIQDFYWLIFGLTLVLSIYGFLQHYKVDFVKWVTSYNPICLFTGNPDFAASLLGFFGILCFAGIFLDFSKAVKILIGILVIFDVIVIHFTQAFQGVAVLVIGMGIVLLAVVFQRSKKIAFVVLLLELLIGFVSLLGMMNIGPMGKYLYKASVVDRGYDWRAAVAMFKSHPWLGVGIDHYNAYFLQYRSPKYPLIYGYFQSGNNAHNVFLQFFATAGIFAGLVYLSLIIFISYRGYVAVKTRSGKEQLMLAGILAGWLGFVAQQLVSVDFAAISIWGWVFGAVLVKMSVDSPMVPSVDQALKTPKQGRSKGRSASPNNSVVRPIIFGISIIALAFLLVPLHRNNSQPFEFHQTPVPNIQGGREAYLALANRVFDLPLLNPNDKVQVATDLARQGFGPEAVKFLKRSIAVDSRNTNAYAILADVYEHLKDFPNAISTRKQLFSLDPYGAENLVSLENDYILSGERNSAITIRNLIIAMAPETDVAKRAIALITK
jgi:putative inorganic carbon (HCO3(-)) transporter